MGTHPIFESDFDCLTEEREMGTAFSRVGSRVGPNGTQFIGDIQGSAKYGLPLKSHPVQDVIPKSEPLNYIRNTLYPKAGSKFMLLPRQYAMVPHNNGLLGSMEIRSPTCKHLFCCIGRHHCSFVGCQFCLWR